MSQTEFPNRPPSRPRCSKGAADDADRERHHGGRDRGRAWSPSAIAFSRRREAAAVNNVTATLPKGARIYATAVAGDKLVLMLEVNGTTEIRTFDAQTLKPAGSLKFATEP